MITINLRPGQKRKTSGNPMAAVRAQIQAAGARVKDPLLVLAIACWVGVIGWLGWTYTSSARELGHLRPAVEQAQAEHRRFETFIKAKRRQEAIRDSLVSQISVIRTVDGDRYVWPHILDEVAKALPSYTWLVDIGLNGSATVTNPAAAAAAAADSTSDSTAAVLNFQLSGRTIDIQAYTRFLRQLEASPWISNVTPVSAQTVIENEHPVTAFVIRADFQRADSAYIRTVPLSQSVR